MAERLGNVLYWAANAVAIPLVLLGALMGWDRYRTQGLIASSYTATGEITKGSSYVVTWDYRFPLMLCVAGFAVWLFGRACRYVLAGR